MYNFVDTTESPGALPLPAEAMSYGGVYIENEIEGYRTLYVEGRETITAAIEATETQISHGANFKYMRYEPRTLIVGFQLICETAAGMMADYNKLLHILSKKQAQIIFNDEQDKFFTGTKTKITNTPPGRLTVTGEIEIYCADPFKYSVQEYEATATNGVITVDYGGTHPSHPILTAVSENHDNGFYLFENNEGSIIQVGDPKEVDGEEGAHEGDAVTVLSYNFGSNYETANYALDNNYWKRSEAYFPYYSYPQTREVLQGADFLYPKMPSTYTPPSGPSLGHTFTTSEGSHKNFKVFCTHRFNIGWYAGGFDFSVVDVNGDALCGFAIKQWSGSNILWYMLGPAGIVKSGSYVSSQNPFTNFTQHSITKSDSRLTFNIGPNVYSVNIPEIENREAKNMTFSFYFDIGDDPGNRNALKNVTFQDIPETWEDVENKIPTGGLVEINTGSGDITVNGSTAAGIGTLDNAFESFVLDYGENSITCRASDWVDDAVYTMKYREVFL